MMTPNLKMENEELKHRLTARPMRDNYIFMAKKKYLKQIMKIQRRKNVISKDRGKNHLKIGSCPTQFTSGKIQHKEAKLNSKAKDLTNGT